ncbi:hypothetical protein M0R45_013385 [Rubus argutus]|uniref:Uncharacterized protein n=1 Tax=Rubus argutus TaxID=59490 RepID=A0AAW1XJB3_RUBAR
MGSSSSPYLMTLLPLLLISVSVFTPQVIGCYSSIFSFGDSITDTGNLYISSHNRSFHFFFPPYGETYFHRPTGRCSDGRLIIDFIAEFLGLPHVRPYLELKSNLSAQNLDGGVNFAVIGATALDVAFLAAMGDHNEYTNSSLGTQLECFKEILPSLCNTSSDCNKLLSSSLILVGEIGGNDYNNPLRAGKSIELLVQTYVPLVIKVISSTIKELIDLGAVTLLVPGNFPIGCLPIYLTKFQTSDETNYYNAMMHFYHSPYQYGFMGGTTKACCGGGGPYNYNSSAQCGSLKATACENPAQFINWDGMHLTEAAYSWIAKALLKGKYTIPSISTLCVSEV